MKLTQEIRECTHCEAHLPMGCNPVFEIHKNSKIVIIGQAPGIVVHQTNIGWDDKSGDNLRRWLGVTREQFYAPELFAFLPMGFCYPGRGKSGDLPPRPECAPKWHHLALASMPDIELILLVGKYAQDYYLKDNPHRTLTETVRHYADFLPQYFPLPHPSPRNNIWMKRNDWFAKSILPELATYIREAIHVK